MTIASACLICPERNSLISMVPATTGRLEAVDPQLSRASPGQAAGV